MSEYSDHDQDTTKNRGCIAAAAAIVGAKWTPQILYALCQETSPFCELQKAVGGVNPRTLSARLDELEHAGIVQKAAYAEMPPRIEYSLTTKGRDLIPILETMIAWGNKYPAIGEDC